MRLFAAIRHFSYYICVFLGAILSKFARNKLDCYHCNYYLIQWEKLILIRECYTNDKNRFPDSHQIYSPGFINKLFPNLMKSHNTGQGNQFSDKQKNLPACLVDKLNYFLNSNAW